MEAAESVEVVRYGVHCEVCRRSVGDYEEDRSKMRTATENPWGVQGFGCPWCSCGATSDWEHVAPLRCTCCHRALLISSPFTQTKGEANVTEA